MIPADLLQLRSTEDGAVRIPLDCNRNDKDTLFAGSIYVGAVLAGYRHCEALVRQRGLTGELVCSSARVVYLAPIRSDGVAKVETCEGMLGKLNGNFTFDLEIHVRDSAGTTAAKGRFEYVLVTG